MARYLGSACRLCRREGTKLFLKGDRCFSEKCAIEKRAYPPGMHGQGRTRFSDYGVQLREKQKVKRMYGLLEKQFRHTFDRASGMKGRAGENLLLLLERRLDNVVFRLGFATSRNEARQLVKHGHFTVNGRKVKSPSLLLKDMDTVSKGGPIHIFNGTNNLLAKHGDRDVENMSMFHFTNRYCGTRRMGYRKTSEYCQGDVSVADAMAISGAAVTATIQTTLLFKLILEERDSDRVRLWLHVIG